MKVILTNDESKLGKKGDLLTVADGYARNYLIPKGKAIRATVGAEREAEETRKIRELKLAKDLDTAKEIAARLKNSMVTLGARASEEGSLYGSISSTDIVNAVIEQHKITLQKESIILDNPIREVGTHSVEISAHKEVVFRLPVEIVAI